MTPDKYIKGQSRFEAGIPYNYANETADDFLKVLQQNKVDTIDFRQIMKQGGQYTLDSFYKTDHHWKVQTAFWAYTQFVDVLEQRFGLSFPHKAEYTDPKNFDQVTYKDAYIGSMARKEGILYSTAEDFTFIYPRFDTSFDFYAQSGSDQLNRQGRFEQSVAFTSILSGNGDPYDADNDKFFTYMDGNPGFVDITNMNEPKGPKVLFIKDSLMVPVASFFALGCSKVYMVDPRYYSGSIEKLLRLPTPGSGDAARETDAAWDLAAVSRMERSEKGTQLAAGAENEEKAAREAEENGHSAGMPAGETAPEEWRETVRSLQKQLEDEKKARAELETKLAYSTDLLLRIYKK